MSKTKINPDDPIPVTLTENHAVILLALTHVSNALADGFILSVALDHSGKLLAVMTSSDLSTHIEIDGKPSATIHDSLQTLDEALEDHADEQALHSNQA